MGTKNWCNVERQNLAAYEYLCHVSEAKEWTDGYQGMLNAIARDIRTKAQRWERWWTEMRRIRITLLNLKE
ncbi:hypothetical protein GGF46_000330, partial [Coemansia sp. RSA 552]